MSLKNLSFVFIVLFCAACTQHTKREINKFESLGDIQKLTKIVSSGGKTERVTAIRALGKLKDPRAINALSAGLDSPSWVEREAVVVSLGMINDHLSLPLLLKALKDQNQFVRERAASELINVSKSLGKKKNTRILKTLMKGIKVNNTFARTEAEKAFQIAVDQLRYIKKPKFIFLLIESLKDDNRYLRRQAALALGKLNDERAIQPLLDAQGNRDFALRDIASKSLKKIHNPRSVSQFVESIRTGDENVREKAVIALSGITDRRDILRLESYLQDKTPAVRIGIVRVLGNINKGTSTTRLVKLLDDREVEVRKTVSDTLAKTGWVPASDADKARFCIAAQKWSDCLALGVVAVPELVRRLADDDSNVRKNSARILHSLEWEPASDDEAILNCVATREWETCSGYGEKALGALIRELNDPDQNVIKAIVKVLVEIKHIRALQPLIGILGASDVDMRLLVVEALGTFNHPLAMKTLIKTLEDKNQHVRQAAADALSNNIKLSKEKEYFDLKSPLLVAVKDNNQHVRIIASTLLGELQSPDTIADLIATLNDSHLEVRKAASSAIRKFTDTSAISHLVKGLENRNPVVRKDIVEALSRFKDYRALEPLPALLADKDASVVLQTIEALGRIDDPGTIEPLLGMLVSSNPEFVVSAIDSLSGKRDPAILTRLYEISLHKKAVIRVNAGEALLKHNWTPNTKSEQGKLCVINQDWLKCEKIGAPAVEALLLELSDPDSESRIESARTLGHIQDLRAIKPLINSMLSKDWTDNEYRANKLIETSQLALGNFGKLALPELVGQLSNWNVNQHLVKVLDSIGWLPRTDTQLIHLQIARRSKDELLGNWPLTLRILLDDIKSAEPALTNNALLTFIALGKEEGISVLLKTLKEKGSVELAEAYLNCGNDMLRAAALEWTSDHDLEIKEFGAGNTPVKWGEF